MGRLRAVCPSLKRIFSSLSPAWCECDEISFISLGKWIWQEVIGSNNSLVFSHDPLTLYVKCSLIIATPLPPPPSFFWIFLYICMYACICICTKFLNYIGVVICCNKLSKVLLPPTSPKQKELSYFFIVLVGGKIVGYDLGWKQLQKMMAISLLLASTRIII